MGSDIFLRDESILIYFGAALGEDGRLQPQTRLLLLTQGTTLAYGRYWPGCCGGSLVSR